MPFVPVERGLECVFHQNLAGRPIINVLHAQQDSAGSGALLDMANDLHTLWGDWMILNLSSQLVLTAVTVRDISVEFGDVAESTMPDRPGTGAGEPIAANVACLVRKVTGKVGRHRRGRMYLSGLTEAMVIGAGGGYSAATMTSLQNGVNAFVGNAENIGPVGVSINLVVVSRYQGVDQFGKPIPRAAGIATPITQMVVDPVIATQRGRVR